MSMSYVDRALVSLPVQGATSQSKCVATKQKERAKLRGSAQIKFDTQKRDNICQSNRSVSLPLNITGAHKIYNLSISLSAKLFRNFFREQQLFFIRISLVGRDLHSPVWGNAQILTHIHEPMKIEHGKTKRMEKKQRQWEKRITLTRTDFPFLLLHSHRIEC